MIDGSGFIELTAQDGVTISAYRAQPVGKARAGLIVVQEIFGVNAHIRNVAHRFAAHGYEVLAPAFFDRIQRGVELPYDQDGIARGRAFVPELGLERPLLDVRAAAERLSHAGKVGIVGYCWGGSLSYLAATSESHLASAVGYYGGTIAKHADRAPRVPVLLHFGSQDKGIPLTDVASIRERRPEVTVHVYDAQHGFNCDARGAYDGASADLALRRTLAFFAETLG